MAASNLTWEAAISIIRRAFFTVGAIASAGLFVASCASASSPARLDERSITVGGVERYYLEHEPRGLGENAPLVILLHGGGQSMREIFERRSTATRHWLKLSDREGFLLLAPNGTDPETGNTDGDNQNWNDLRTDGGAPASEADDVSFILTLIDDAVARHRIDRSRVYVTGASNGGMMTYRLLVEQPDSFAAAAAFIANLPAAEVPTAPAPTPIMIASGTEDEVVPYEGGEVKGGRGTVRSADQTVDYWLAINRAIDGRPETVVLPDLDPDDDCRLEVISYPAGRNGADLLFLRMNGGGHIMPSASAPRQRRFAKRLVGQQCRDAEGASLAWDFMSRHTR